MSFDHYRDVYYQPGEAPVFCYRTGLTVYEETLFRGALVPSGWNTAGYPLNVLSNFPTRLDPCAWDEPAAFSAVLNGRSLEYGLSFADFSVEEAEGCKTARLSLVSDSLPVGVTVVTVTDGAAMFTRRIEITNQGDTPLCLSKLTLFGGGTEALDRTPLTTSNDVSALYSVGYFGNDQWGHEGAFCWRPLTPGVFSIDTRFGADRYRHPLVFIKNNLTGVIWFSQIAFSGGCRFSVGLDAAPDRSVSLLRFDAGITGYAPLTVIGAGETFVSPEVHVGAVAGDLDAAVNAMHAHIRRSVLTLPEAKPQTLYVGAGMGAEHDMSVETTKSFMRQMKDMGAEVFIIDAGWACPPAEKHIDWGGYNGVNLPDPDRYPNGLKEVSDYCRSLGMKFALWVEIERLGSLAPLHAEKPDWRVMDVFGRRDGGFLDFTNPEVCIWAENELARIITEYSLDLLRVDYNVSHKSYSAMADAGTGVTECISLRQFEAVYAMYRRIKQRFPQVIFENCAGGGGRTDLGMMRCFHHTWVSDWQKMPRAALITSGMTMALPPERVDRLFAGMGGHACGTLDAQMRNTMLTHMSLNVIAPASAQPNPQAMAFVRHSVQLYKDFIRPFLSDCLVFHHTPEAERALADGKMILEIASPDAQKGAVGVFTFPAHPGEEFFVVPRGASAQKTYRVMFDNTGDTAIINGFDLLSRGVCVRIGAPMASELILYEATE